METKGVQSQVEKGLMLPLMEAFYTIQGEGYHKGTAAYFIRVGGCDVGCHWCDVKESWNAETHPPPDIHTIATEAARDSDTIVITGMKIHTEPSGAYPLTGVWDWICLSPKKNKLPLDPIPSRADELKVIVYNRHDLIFAEQQAENVSGDCLLYLQPEWSVREKVTPLIVEYVMANPKWRVSLQTHKYLNIP